MARGKGHQSIAAFVAGGSTWGTAVTASTGHGIYTNNHKITGGIETIPDNAITGAYFQKISTPGAHKASVSFEADLVYQGFERCIANFFGQAGTPSAADTSAYQHVLKAADRDSVFGTFVYEGVKDTTVVEAPSVQFNKLTLSGKAMDVVKLSMEGMADDVVIASSVNTTSSIDTVTVVKNTKVPFSHVSFLLNNQSAGSLASAPIYVNGFELSLDRPIDMNVTTERGNKSSLFIPKGFLSGKLKIDFSIAQNGTGGNIAMITDHLAATAEKAKIVATGTTLIGAATQYEQHVIWLPNLRSLPTDVLPVQGPDGITWSQEFEIAQVSTAPTGFTSGYTDGVVWEIFSLLSTDPLAAT